jgi:ATP-dependent exoDNAse (exonuclease V) alpha subunit
VRRLLSVVRDRIPARFANNYDRDVFNGDLGVITGLDAEEGSSSSPSTAGR